MHRPTDASLTPRFAVRGLFALIFLVFSSPLCAAATLYVSQDGNDNNSGTATSPYKTIQAAVNNANAGDTITLHASTFSGNGNRDIDFAGKSLTVNSDSGAARTVIDCGGTDQERHRAFYLHSKEKGVIFEGLTIKNSSDRGAIDIEQDCTIKIDKCIFTGNTSDSGGGGVSNSGNVAVESCTFANNDRGSIRNYGQATLSNSTFKNNTMADSSARNIENEGTLLMKSCAFTQNGLGLVNFSKIILADCTFTNNTAEGVSNGGSAALTGCTFTGNKSEVGGAFGNGGFGCYATLTDCTFIGNSAITKQADKSSGSGGGGAVSNGYVMTMTNCCFIGNRCNGSGGAVLNFYHLQMRYCSFFDNATQGDNTQGGALENNDNVTMINCILWGNVAPYESEIGIPDHGNPLTTATYCDIQGGLSGTGNIKANPLFISTANAIMPPIAVINRGNADLHLQAGSPCRGAGITIGPTKADPSRSSSKPDAGVSTDADGRRRPNPPSIGAYEYTANPPPAKKTLLIDAGSTDTGITADGATSAPGTAAVPMTGVTAAPPAAPQARLVLGPAEQKQANDEFLHLMVSLNTNTLSHDEMTRQIQGELAKGAQIDARDGEGFPAIVTAASLKRTDVVQVLLELGADPNALTVQVSSSDANANDDASILHKTATGYQVNVGAVVSSIFGRKAKPKPVYGQSALMFAAQNGVADMVTLLLNGKVVVNMRDNRGKSALDYAADAHHDDVVATLKAHGAD